MNIYLNRGLEHLNKMRLFPGMFASVRESFLSEISGILIVLCKNFSTAAFYAKHAPACGNMYLNLDKKVEDAWAHEVIDAAIKILKTEELSYNGNFS